MLGRLVVAVETLGEVGEFSLVELLDERTVCRLATKTLLQSLEKHAVEFLYILLVKSFVVVPLEGLDQFLGRDVGQPQFQLREQLLQLEQNAVLPPRMYLLVVPPLVNALSEFGSHEESLQQAVYVARSAYVRQSFIIG